MRQGYGILDSMANRQWRFTMPLLAYLSSDYSVVGTDLRFTCCIVVALERSARQHASVRKTALDEDLQISYCR